MKAKFKNKVSKAEATQVHPENNQSKPFRNIERLVGFPSEYPQSNLRKLTEITARFRARYDEEGAFKLTLTRQIQ